MAWINQRVDRGLKMLIPLSIGLLIILIMSKPTKAFSVKTPVDQQIMAYSSVYGISPFLVKAVIKTESDFDPNATSYVGARGLMQLMLATARIYKPYVTAHELYNPQVNISIGAKFLRDLIDRYGSIEDALAHYNLGKVDRWTYVGRQRIIKKYGDLLSVTSPTNPKYRTYKRYYDNALNAKVGDYVNYGYVNKVMKYYRIYQA